ncbi:hypothetical protein BYT27DRAFT_7113337 [Phlegmacium glaucopus]|nr:hypothetical protein BYT27DRAFT_7113337 [Phlegmacium glaucopus]
MDPSSRSLPVEILHVIFNEVDSSNDQQTLKVCSLASRLFCVLCRKHLFSRVTILVTPDTTGDDEDQQNNSAVQFLSFLVADDHTSSFIQNLSIRNDTGVPLSSTWTTVTRSLHELLPKLSRLTSLSIHGNLIADWTSSVTALRDVLMRLCRRPNLKTLNLNFLGISQQEMFSFVGVTNLSLSSIHLNPDALYPVSGLQENLSSPNNASRLSTLSVDFRDLRVSQVMWSLAKAAASTLESLKWMSSPYYRQQQVFLHLIDLQILPKLTSLAICIPLREESSLRDLIILLGTSPERNVLEILEIVCDYDHLPAVSSISTWAWQELDDVLASPALAGLQAIRVSIKNLIRPRHIPSRNDKEHAREAVQLFQNSLPNAYARGLIYGDEKWD